MSNAWVIYLRVGDNTSKGVLIPDMVSQRMVGRLKVGILRDLPLGEKPAYHQLVGRVTAYQGLRLAGLRGWSATLGLRHCPDSYGRLQSRIICNARKRDNARCVEDDGLRVVNSCHSGKIVWVLITPELDGTERGSHG